MKFDKLVDNTKRKLRSLKNRRYQRARHRSFNNSPLELGTDFDGKCYTNISVHQCRTNYFGFPMLESPFLKTLRAYESGECTCYEDSPIASFYRSCQPSSMAEVLAIQNEQMEVIPAMASVMPWWNISIEECLSLNSHDPGADALLSKEAVLCGLSEQGNYGWQYFGPVSDEVGKLEFARLTSVYDSIKKHGFLYKKTAALHGEFLINGEEWVWTALGGKHRVSALAALTEGDIPVTSKWKYSPRFVQREDVATWYHVKSQLFSVNEALKVFDAMMDSRCPSHLRFSND